MARAELLHWIVDRIVHQLVHKGDGVRVPTRLRSLLQSRDTNMPYENTPVPDRLAWSLVQDLLARKPMGLGSAGSV